MEIFYGEICSGFVRSAECPQMHVYQVLARERVDTTRAFHTPYVLMRELFTVTPEHANLETDEFGERT